MRIDPAEFDTIRRQEAKDREDKFNKIEEQLISSLERCTCLGSVEIANGASISRLTKSLMSKIKEL